MFCFFSNLKLGFIAHELLLIYITFIHTYIQHTFIHSTYIYFGPFLSDAWKSRLRLNGENEPHKCAAIFIDNSGVDVILGILPFVEHLLSRGTEVSFHVFNATSLRVVCIKYVKWKNDRYLYLKIF